MENINFRSNQVILSGEIKENFTFNHEVFGEGFYGSSISVLRDSGTVDCIPIVVSERLVDVKADWVGQYVKIDGQFRSFNKHESEKNSLILSVFVRDMETLEDVNNQNEIYLRGFICKQPAYRKTPLGREIADVLLAVNRAYGKSDYIPCILWGRNARFASELEVGTACELWGRVQSREYVKKHSETDIETKVAYEVSVGRIEV